METMKIAISVPDGLFQDGERLARERGLSRSELYATALRDYLQVHGDAALTKRFDAVYAQQESRLDPPLAQAQQRGIADEAW